MTSMISLDCRKCIYSTGSTELNLNSIHFLFTYLSLSLIQLTNLQSKFALTYVL